MHVAVLAYSFGGVSLASTFAVTVLNGLCYASSKSALSPNSSIEIAPVVLSCLDCISLTALLLLLANDVKTGIQQRGRWKVKAYCPIIAYLFVAIGITAGAIASSHTELGRARSLLIARCVIWAVSSFTKGLFGGLILMYLCNGRSRSDSSDLEMLPDISSMRTEMIRKSPSPTFDSQRPSLSADPKISSDGLTPIQHSASSVSNRYSGRTLFQQDSKRSSLDQSSAGLSASDKLDGLEDRDASPAVDRNGSHKIQRSHSEIKRSLDSVVLSPSPGPSSPTASSINLELPTKPPPPKVKITKESNIHPLFRSDSPSPPPTPTVGTIVKASPVAGQTITMKTLSRVRSTNSLRVNGPRSRSPLFERMDQDQDQPGDQGLPKPGRIAEPSGNMPGFILAADVRRSISQYEKRYDLNESPHES
ncbi:hypothetical protein ASPWEDRAFT_263052 [Aspergillus wentii DTO 134E9]|uniref:Uncharacterized protein n=1 Tax=Aspergillus wentii DTO 134E9 TaxID=1073089 RepID=A0A1L9S2H0_ASPWE|nr:uncharacterized protein ASPWEDRAFT_263052 [Aspergillus wentii DTO 134E9]KAI9924397.1 hypothetical protein MW887_007023 [Aspergillus wentii]OJJ41353.1 hypothetical protein ASPWEDRAFT_263052 [Aspergillus wentii DTO 134E9]